MNQTNLKQYFPTIRTKEEILKEIEASKMLKTMFYDWNVAEREDFLDMCTGLYCHLF